MILHTKKTALTLAASVIFASVLGCNEAPKPQSVVQQKPNQVSVVDAKKCLLDKAMHEKYAELTAKGDNWKAARAISNCADATQDAELLAKVKASEIKVWTADFKNKSKSASERVEAYEKLKELDAASAQKMEQEFKVVAKQANYDAEISKAIAKQNLKHTGALIGMTSSQVMQSNWGYPNSIHKTTTAFGVREQWVYGEGKYLYFDNGVLTAIQE